MLNNNIVVEKQLKDFEIVDALFKVGSDFRNTRRFARYIEKRKMDLVEYLRQGLFADTPKASYEEMILALFPNDAILKPESEKIGYLPMFDTVERPIEDVIEGLKSLESYMSANKISKTAFEESLERHTRRHLIMRLEGLALESVANAESNIMSLDNFISLSEFKNNAEKYYTVYNILNDVVGEAIVGLNICEYKDAMNLEVAEKVQEQVEESHSELLAKLLELRAELDLVKEENEKLKNRPEVREKVVVDAEMVTRIQALEKENLRLRDNFERIKQQNEALGSKEDIGVIPEGSLTIPDYTKRYLFVVEFSDSLPNKLRAAYSNCTVVTSRNASGYNLSATDAVVFITSALSHSLYETIKAECISAGVKYVFCANTNLKIIGDCIAKNI